MERCQLFQPAFEGHPHPNPYWRWRKTGSSSRPFPELRHGDSSRGRVTDRNTGQIQFELLQGCESAVGKMIASYPADKFHRDIQFGREERAIGSLATCPLDEIAAFKRPSLGKIFADLALKVRIDAADRDQNRPVQWLMSLCCLLR